MTPAMALPLDRWKILQKHSFSSKFSAGSAPPPQWLCLWTTGKYFKSTYLCQNFLRAPLLTPGPVVKLCLKIAGKSFKSTHFCRIFHGLRGRPSTPTLRSPWHGDLRVGVGGLGWTLGMESPCQGSTSSPQLPPWL